MFRGQGLPKTSTTDLHLRFSWFLRLHHTGIGSITSGPPNSSIKVQKTQKDLARQTNDKIHHPPNNSIIQSCYPLHKSIVVFLKKNFFQSFTGTWRWCFFKPLEILDSPNYSQKVQKTNQMVFKLYLRDTFSLYYVVMALRWCHYERLCALFRKKYYIS